MTISGSVQTPDLETVGVEPLLLLVQHMQILFPQDGVNAAASVVADVDPILILEPVPQLGRLLVEGERLRGLLQQLDPAGVDAGGLVAGVGPVHDQDFLLLLSQKVSCGAPYDPGSDDQIIGLFHKNLLLTLSPDPICARPVQGAPAPSGARARRMIGNCSHRSAFTPWTAL